MLKHILHFLLCICFAQSLLLLSPVLRAQDVLAAGRTQQLNAVRIHPLETESMLLFQIPLIHDLERIRAGNIPYKIVDGEVQVDKQYLPRLYRDPLPTQPKNPLSAREMGKVFQSVCSVAVFAGNRPVGEFNPGASGSFVAVPEEFGALRKSLGEGEQFVLTAGHLQFLESIEAEFSGYLYVVYKSVGRTQYFPARVVIGEYSREADYLLLAVRPDKVIPQLSVARSLPKLSLDTPVIGARLHPRETNTSMMAYRVLQQAETRISDCASLTTTPAFRSGDSGGVLLDPETLDAISIVSASTLEKQEALTVGYGLDSKHRNATGSVGLSIALYPMLSRANTRLRADEAEVGSE